MHNEKRNKLLGLIVIVLIFVIIFGAGIQWLVSKKRVRYDHSISALEMARQQDYFEVKFFLGMVLGILVGWLGLCICLFIGIHKTFGIGTSLIAVVLLFLMTIPAYCAKIGYRDATYFVSLKEWLPFSIAYGTGLFFGFGLQVLYYFIKHGLLRVLHCEVPPQ